MVNRNFVPDAAETGDKEGKGRTLFSDFDGPGELISDLSLAF